MPELETALDETVESVLEGMFFSFIAGPGEPPAGAGLTAGVAFSGAKAGELEVRAGEATAAKLAASFLGSEETATEDEVSATFGELANVICGALLGRLDPSGRFSITEPSVRREPDLAAVADPLGARRIFELEEGTLEVGFRIE